MRVALTSNFDESDVTAMRFRLRFHCANTSAVLYAVIGGLNPSQSVSKDPRIEDRIEVDLLLVIP